jgi:hypothetical protein
LGAVFDKDWEKGQRLGATVLPALPLRQVKAAHSGDLTLVGSPENELPKGIGYSLREIKNLLAQAAQSGDTVDVQTMDYSLKVFGKSRETWTELDDALRDAAKRGAKVRLLLEYNSAKKVLKDLRSLAAVKNIQIKTVTIPEAAQGPIEYARLIHSKYLIVNGKKAWVGTDNWAKSYFYSCRGVGLITTSAETVSTLQAVYQKLWDSPYAKLLKP